MLTTTTTSSGEAEPFNKDEISKHIQSLIQYMREHRPESGEIVGQLFDLSLIEPTEANAEALIQAFREMRRSFTQCSVAVSIEGLATDQLRVLAEFINRLPLPTKTTIELVKKADELSVSNVRFLIENISNKDLSGFSLSGIPLATSSSHDKFIEIVDFIVSTDGPFRQINFSRCGIHTVPKEVIRQQFQRLREKGVKRVNLYNVYYNVNFKLSDLEDLLSFGVDFLWELRNQFGDMLVNVFPHGLYLSDQKSYFEKFATALEPEKRAKLAEVFLGCGMENNGCYHESLIPEFAILRSQHYELAERLLLVAIRSNKLFIFKKLLKTTLRLSSDELFKLCKKSFEYGCEDFEFKHLDLSYSHRLELVMLGSQELPYYFFSGAELKLNTNEGHPGVRDIFSAIRVTMSGSDETSSGDSSESADEEDIYQQISLVLFPGLRRVCRNHLSGFPFLLKGLSTIEETYQKGEEYFYPVANMVGWFSWICIKLMQIYSNKDKVPSSREIDLLEKVFKEILGFVSPLMRYKIAGPFFELYQDEQFSSTLRELTHGRGNFSVLPAVVLSQIVCEDSVTHEDSKQVAMEFLDSISASQYDGHYFRTLVYALLSVSQEETLAPAVKLGVLKQIFSKLPEHTAALSGVEAITADFVQGFIGACVSKNPRANHLVVTVGESLSAADKKRLKAERASRQAFCQGVITDFAGYCKSVDLRDAIIKVSPKRLEDYIPNAIDGSDVEKKQVALSRYLRLHVINEIYQQYKDQEFRLQVSRLITVQGLANLGALGEVRELNADTLTEFMRQLLNLSPDQAALYPKVFGECRNQGALLTYYSKIRMLENSQKGKDLIAFFKGFVQSVLSEGSRDYYEKRYQKVPGSHCELVFSGKPELERKWRQGRNESFAQFYKRKKIKVNDFEPDFPEFLQSRIFGHQHIDVKHYDLLKEYLEAVEVSVRDNIHAKADQLAVDRKAKLDENSEDYALKQQWYHAQIQLKLIDLLRLPIIAEKPIKERYQAHQKLLTRIASLLDRVSNRDRQFYRDIGSIISALRQNGSNRAVDYKCWKNWRIVITDHYWDLFMAGTDIEGSCQNVAAHISTNKCLMGFPGDPKTQMAAIQDETGTTVARAMIRILPDLETGINALYLEEMYPGMLRPDFRQALREFTIEFGSELGVFVVSGEAANPDSKPFEGTLTSVSCPAPWEYVDALFGEQEGEFEISAGFILFEPALKLEERLQAVTSEFVSVDSGEAAVFGKELPSPVMLPGLASARPRNTDDNDLYGTGKALDEGAAKQQNTTRTLTSIVDQP